VDRVPFGGVDAVLVTDVGWDKNECYELPAEGRFVTPGGALDDGVQAGPPCWTCLWPTSRCRPPGNGTSTASARVSFPRRGLMIRVIDPFADAYPTWLGLDERGRRRKVFKVVDQHINTGREPLWPVFVYGPHGALART
jgi:hypothetical protein